MVIDQVNAIRNIQKIVRKNSIVMNTKCELVSNIIRSYQNAIYILIVKIGNQKKSVIIVIQFVNMVINVIKIRKEFAKIIISIQFQKNRKKYVNLVTSVNSKELSNVNKFTQKMNNILRRIRSAGMIRLISANFYKVIVYIFTKAKFQKEMQLDCCKNILLRKQKKKSLKYHLIL